MTDYLLDTNHVSWLMAQHEVLTARFRQAQNAGDRFGISVIILGELYYAVYASERHDDNLRRLRTWVSALWVWPFDALAAEEFGRIQAEQKVKGRPIPPLDAQIAAVARINDLVLLTDDRYFTFVDGIAIENWRI